MTILATPGPAGRAGSTDKLEDWERPVVNSVGDAIRFWGFKWNHGRVWCLLYLRAMPMTARELQTALGLSKGAASMIIRELEQWGPVRRVRVGKDSSWRFVAETNLMRMVGRVIQERESKIAARFLEELKGAREIGLAAKQLPPETLRRLEKMEKALSLSMKSMDLFLKTSRFDFSNIVHALRGEGA